MTIAICRSCWRGQAYCGPICRHERQSRDHRETQRRYRQTPKGKTTHAASERQRRKIQDDGASAAGEDSKNTSPVEKARASVVEVGHEIAEDDVAKNTMADVGSRQALGNGKVEEIPSWGMHGSQKWGESRRQTPDLGAARCHFCGCPGVVIDEFPRRGY